MKENKKIFGRAAGVFALALVFALVLAACGGGGDDGGGWGGDGGSGGGGGGGSNGTTTLGETLIITGAQIYGPLETMGSDYEKYTGGNVDFTVADDDYRIGGHVKITGEKLDFTANAITAENLDKVLDEGDEDYSSLGSYLNLIVWGGGHKNFVISGSGWENAKYAVLGSLSRNEDGRRDRLSRFGYTTREVKKDGENHYIIAMESVDYVYVDTTITVTADETSEETSDSSGTRIEILKPLNITLQKGWNVLYSYSNSSTDAVTYTDELKTGDPSNVHWTNDWEKRTNG